MSRQLVQIIRCDLCQGTVESEEELDQFDLVWDGQTYTLETCHACGETVEGLTIRTLLDAAHKTSAPSKKKRLRKPRAQAVAGVDPLACGWPDCDFVGKTKQGVGRHRTAAGHRADVSVGELLPA